MNEVRVFGPPGTGKTTYLARQVTRAAQARGSQNVMVASFTRAAATEIAGRNLPVERAQLGTLHALCYRALGRPDIAEGKLKDWNEHAPHLALSSGGSIDLDHAAFDQVGQTEGDRLLNQVERLRAQMRPTETWPTSARAFWTRWTEWKHANDLVDFTELIETSLHLSPPGSPTIGFFDEVQDFTPLDLALVRRWSESMETVLLAGDDDQCIYRFRGATPDAFLDPPVTDEHKRILAQSYRVPAAVHRFSQSWVSQLARREPKDYEPRDEEGEVVVLDDGHWRTPRSLVRSMLEDEQAGETVMLLASCSYMLDPTIKLLRAEGVPFHNPYRRKRGDWNPLAPRQDAVTASDRVLALLRPDIDVWGDDARVWDATDAQRWMQPMQAADVFRRGAKKLMQERAKDPDDLDELDLAWMVEHIFSDPDELSRAFDGDLEWWRSRLLKSSAKTLTFPIEVARRRGPVALTQAPRILLGTIHSVKGGEADVVYLLPDVSGAGMREWMQRGDARDSVTRQFYVGATRARRKLVLVPPQSRAHVPLHKHIEERK